MPLDHSSSSHSLTASSSVFRVPFCAYAAISTLALAYIALKMLIDSQQHFSICVAGTWLGGTCNLTMTVTVKGVKFFVSSIQPPTRKFSYMIESTPNVPTTGTNWPEGGRLDDEGWLN